MSHIADAVQVEKISVLLVDDNLAFLRSASRFIETSDALQLVGQARGGEEALALLDELKPDVVLLDQHMPGLSGLETAPRLRRQMPRLCIIMLTFDASEALRRAALDASVNAFIAKSAFDTQLIPAILNCARVHFPSPQ